MKVSNTILIGTTTIALTSLAVANVLACNGGYGYGSYSSASYPRYVERAYVSAPSAIAPTFSPTHSVIVVMPGDSWFTICSREYGNTNVWSKVAAFNGMAQNVRLTTGMQLRLPIVNPNGSLGISSAPPAVAMQPQGFTGGLPQGPQQGFAQGNRPSLNGVPQTSGIAPQGQGFAQQLPMGMPQGDKPGPQGQSFGPQQLPTGLPQGAQFGPHAQPGMPPGAMGPQPPEGEPKNDNSVSQRIAEELTGFPGLGGSPVNPNAGPTARPVPSILIGSIMSINGQPLGEGRGTVRLIVNGSPVPLEILEWSASAAKVRVPADLPADLQVQIEILRADGSVVTKDTVKLTAGQQMAATK